MNVWVMGVRVNVPTYSQKVQGHQIKMGTLDFYANTNKVVVS